MLLLSARNEYVFESELNGLLDRYGEMLGNMNPAAIVFTVTETLFTLKKMHSKVIGECEVLKSGYTIYDTAYFLNQPSTASIELISEAVALQKSQVAAQTTLNAEKDPKQRLFTPNFFKAGQMISNSDRAGTWDNWKTLNAQLQQSGLF